MEGNPSLARETLSQELVSELAFLDDVLLSKQLPLSSRAAAEGRRTQRASVGPLSEYRSRTRAIAQ